MKKGISYLCKIVLMLVTFSFCSVSLAGGPEHAPPPSFNGFFAVAGLQAVGMKLINPYLDIRNGPNGGPYGQNISLRDNTGTKDRTKTDWNGAIRGGVEWGHVFTFDDPTSGLYVGANLNYLTGVALVRRLTASPVTAPAAPPLQNQSLFLQTSLNIDRVLNGLVKLGYAWNTFLFYLQLGFSGAQISYSQPQFVFATNFAVTRWDPGYSGGVGLEALLTPKLILGVNYLYTYYKQMAFAGASNLLPGGQALSGWVHTSFQTNRVGLYLKYRLNL